MSQEQEKTIDQLNEEADIAADYLEGLLDIVDYEGDIELGVRNHRPTVQIVADDDSDIKHLIGHEGEVVDALQQLTRLAVQQKMGERSHLIVDVDGFLQRKRTLLREKALDAIDEVRETGEQVDMPPMNSFERKIVHDMVREEGLKSRSHGEEPHRYVSVYLKSSGQQDDDVQVYDSIDEAQQRDTHHRHHVRKHDMKDEAFDASASVDDIDGDSANKK